MIALNISADLPSHTRTWLQYLDSAIAERVGPEMADRIEEARRQYSYIRQRPANLSGSAYFLNLYANMLSDQQFESAKRAAVRVWPRIPEREVAA